MVTPKDIRKTPTVVYGGPYADESDAITKESLKENANYDALIADWKTISTGAQAYIEQVQKPVEAPVGEFVSNYEPSEEEKENPEIPAVVPFVTPDEEVINPDATNETVPSNETNTSEETSSTSDSSTSSEPAPANDSLKDFGL